MRYTVKNKERRVKESIIEITLFPQSEKEKFLIDGAKNAQLNEEDHEYFNNLLTSICLNNNFTPIDSAGHQGNSFFFRVLN